MLGGGAATGNAWLIGVMAGLFDGGFDARRADLVVGTSAGSTAAAQIGGADPSELYSAIIDPATVRQTELAAASRPSGPLKPEHLQRLLTVAGESSDLVDFRRRMGAAALDDPALS